MNVVTLVPSATEIAYALGVEPVGVSHECDYPSAARELPSVTESRIDADGTSAEIDEAVADDRAAYDVDEALLESLDPDLIVTQGVCEVCAVDTVLVAEAVDRIDADPEILTTDPHSIDDVLEDVRRIGAALGRQQEAADLVEQLEARIDAVEGTAASVDRRPRVVVFDWLDPVMVAGHWVPEIVELAGGEHGLAAPGERSGRVRWDAVREYDPEVIVAAPCGFDLERTREHLHELADRPGWEEISAVATGRVYAVDGNDYVNRPGPRLVDTLEHVAGAIHPELFESPPEDALVRVEAGTRPV